jgi:oxygen-independent coproporphyrinogen-3 oxidase
MFGLPVQTPAIASADLQTALALDPGHLSYYQLTIEPNTGFHRIPPKLPGEDEIWQTQLQGQAALAAAGYTQYEVSAYALTGQRCRHNLNYWSFGDYLGIGAGAHGKLTDRSGSVLRFSKWRHPEKYLAQVKQGRAIYNQRLLTEGDLILEFLMNQFRLLEGFDRSIFIQRTGLPVSLLEPGIKLARAKGLLNGYGNCIETTPLGRRFLNDLLVLFLPD